MPPAYVRKGYSLIRVDPTKGKDGPLTRPTLCVAGSSKPTLGAGSDAGKSATRAPPCENSLAEVGAPQETVNNTEAPPSSDSSPESESDAEVRGGPDIVVPPIWRHLSLKEFFGGLLYELHDATGTVETGATENGGEGEPQDRVHEGELDEGENGKFCSNLGEEVAGSPTPSFVRVETVSVARSDGDASDTSSVSGNWEVYESESSEGEANGDEDDRKGDSVHAEEVPAMRRCGTAKGAPPAGPSEHYYYTRLGRNQIVRQGLENRGTNGAAPAQSTPSSAGGGTAAVAAAAERSRSPPSLVRMGSRLYRSQYTNHSRKLERVHNKITRSDVGHEVGGPVGGLNLCTSYQKTGMCKWGSSCRYVHDPDKVAVCPMWLHGNCERDDCKLQHAMRPDLMPNCIHYLNGRCHRPDCPYSHADIDPKAPLCSAFSLGYCPNGLSCPKRHFTPKMLAEMLGSVEEGVNRGKRARAVAGGGGVQDEKQGWPSAMLQV